MRCFVTGATGHLGSALVRALIENEDEVALLARDPVNLKSIEPLRQKFNLLDFRNGYSQDLIRELRVFQPEVAFHLAWEGVVAESRNDPRSIANNVILSMETLEAVRKTGCQRFLGLGSQAEYGLVAGPADESTREAPVTGYGEAKLSCSRLSRAYCSMAGIHWTWVRLYSTYGPGDAPGHFLPYVVDQLLAGKEPELTACEQKWDFLAVEDAASALLELAAPGRSGGIFNLGSGSSKSLREIVELVQEAVGNGCRARFGAVPYRPDQVMHLEPIIARLVEATGWSPRVSLVEGISALVQNRRDRMNVD